METLDLNNKRKREKLTASEWNSLIDAINLLILRYNQEATIPTKLSQLINDAGFITDISGKADKSDLARVATTGSYNDLKDKPDLSNIGSAGKSAYELAVENGYQGSVSQWLASLKGQDGTNGTNGQDGTNGINGTDGITPHIDQTTGNWFIGNTDTGVHAQGSAGQDGSSANQLQADWDQTDSTSADYIKNKPTIPTVPTNYVTTDTTQTISGTKTFSGGRNSFVFTGQNPIKMISPNSSTTGFTFFNSSEDEKGYMQYNQRLNALFLGKYHSDAKTGFLNEPGNVVEEIYIPTPGETGVWYIPIKITDGTTTVSAGSNGTVNMSSFGYAKVWKGTQTEYDAMTTHDSNTIYIIS